MRKFFLSLSVVSLFMASCSNDDDVPTVINEEETITRVELTIVTSDDQTITSVWNDGDAENPVIDLPTNMATMSVRFLDATDPEDIEDITLEVIEEADEHFVEYNWADAPEFRITRADDDETNSDGQKIGIRTDLNAQETAVNGGQLEIRLVHEPESVDDTCGENSCGSTTGGETDVQATFTFNVLG